MQNRYKKRFDYLKNSGKKAFIPFTVLGWKNKTTCFDTVQSFISCGASALELGFAFSDPVADGESIQKASHETIASGFTTEEAFDLIQEIRDYDKHIPIGILTYYNTVLSRGIEHFYARASTAGVDSILIVDLPPESADEVMFAAKQNSIKQIFIVSTLTSEFRLKQILDQAQGFIYVVSRLGVTGSEERYDSELRALINEIKNQSEIPLCVGFGVSSPDKALDLCRIGADGVITGSKIIELIRAAENSSQELLELEPYLQAMVAAVSNQTLNSQIKEVYYA